MEIRKENGMFKKTFEKEKDERMRKKSAKGEEGTKYRY
jgi:hypothetical protein